MLTLANSKVNSCSEKRVKMFISACPILHFVLVTVVLRSRQVHPGSVCYLCQILLTHDQWTFDMFGCNCYLTEI
jgi:hypothetical protein